MYCKELHAQFTIMIWEINSLVPFNTFELSTEHFSKSLILSEKTAASRPFGILISGIHIYNNQRNSLIPNRVFLFQSVHFMTALTGYQIPGNHYTVPVLIALDDWIKVWLMARISTMFSSHQSISISACIMLLVDKAIFTGIRSGFIKSWSVWAAKNQAKIPGAWSKSKLQVLKGYSNDWRLHPCSSELWFGSSWPYSFTMLCISSFNHWTLSTNFWETLLVIIVSTYFSSNMMIWCPLYEAEQVAQASKTWAANNVSTIMFSRSGPTFGFLLSFHFLLFQNV